MVKKRSAVFLGVLALAVSAPAAAFGAHLSNDGGGTSNGGGGGTVDGNGAGSGTSAGGFSFVSNP